MWEWVKALFADAQGRPSAMRLAAYLTVTNIMIVWTYKSIRSDEDWVSMGADTIGLIVGILLAKAYQRKHEKE
jgi:positive regulator of sigma E activity